jgi:tetratricopeptide (TPR) repeat protein
MHFTRTAPWLIVAVLLAAAPSAATAQGAASSYFEFLMARRLEGQGDTKGALAALERAASGDPTSAEIPAEIAAFHLRRNDRDAAEKSARAALVLDEKNVEANRVLGTIKANAADGARAGTPALAAYLKEAITHLERAAAGSVVVDINTHYLLGQLYLRSSDARKAVEAFSRVLSQNPDSFQARSLLAQSQAAAGDVTGAISTLEEAVEDDPRFADLLGQYQEQAGRLKEAIESYTTALAVRPADRAIKLRRISALLNAGDYQRAAQFAADGRRQHPDEVRFAQLHARALFEAGDRSAAVSLLEAAAKSFPRDRDTQFVLADTYNQTGRPADAERVLRQLLAADPDNANVLNYLGYILAERGEQLDEAIRLVRRAVEQQPENGAFLDSLGWAYFRKGDMNEAEKYLSAAAARLPTNSEIQDHLGDLHARRGRWEDAIGAWTRAVNGDAADVDKAAIQKKIDDARRRAR